jgi:hypothetical protein
LGAGAVEALVSNTLSHILGLTLSVILIALFFAAAAVGCFNAAIQREFLVLDTEPKLVVVRMCGSKCVRARLEEREVQKDRGKMKFLSGSFQLVSLSDGNPPAIRREKLGVVYPAQ